MVSIFNNIKVKGISVCVPDTYIDINEELKFFDNDIKLLERNKKILGLRKRHVITKNTSFSDLCMFTANSLIKKLSIEKSSIDTLIVVSTSLDYKYPSTACVIQGLLGLDENCTCLDISGLSCSGYVHGLMIAHSLISSKSSSRVLILCGDLTSTHSDRRNRNSNMLFGDAASATILDYDPSSCFSYFLTGTRGKDYDKLIAPAGGYAIPIKKDIIDLEIRDEKGNVWHMWDDIMKGFDVFKFSAEIGPKGIKDIFEYASTTYDEIDYVAIHQANKQIINTVANFAKIPTEKFSSEAFSEYGNCGAAAVITDICHNLQNKKHDKICIASFGVGLSWGFCILDLKSTYIDSIENFVEPNETETREMKVKYWIDYFKNNK